MVILISTAWATHHSSLPNIQDAPMNYLQANRAVWLHSCMDAQMEKALAGCRTIQIQPSLHSPPPRCRCAAPICWRTCNYGNQPVLLLSQEFNNAILVLPRGLQGCLHVRPQKTLRSPFNKRRIPVKTLLIHMFTASPDMNIGNKVWGYRIYSSRTPTSNALF